MDEILLIKLVKELLQLLPGISEITNEDEIAEGVEAIKRELGAWFIDDYQIYQGS